MQCSFFNEPDLYSRLDKRGDPLSKLNSIIPWEEMRPILSPVTFDASPKGGRPSIDPLILMKCLILQSLYNISDESCEYQINDRLSFKRFLGLDASTKSPDEKTIWLFRERLKSAGLHTEIFNWFSNHIDAAGYEASKGQIVDASFVPTHKPTGKHKKQLKNGEELKPSQISQIDADATFTKKNAQTYHGYKNHINIDTEHKIIRNQSTTTASCHDSVEFENLILTDGCKDVFADSAYRSKDAEQSLSNKGLNSKIHERSYRNNKLTDDQKASNKEKSKIRVRVEHIFGNIVNSMGGMMIHTIGIARAEVKVTFKNLAYNMQRFVFLESKKTRDNCA